MHLSRHEFDARKKNQRRRPAWDFFAQCETIHTILYGHTRIIMLC